MVFSPIGQEVPTDGAQVAEHPHAQGEKGGQIEFSAETVADVGKEGGQESVEEEAADEDSVVKPPFEIGPEPSLLRFEYSVETLPRRRRM